MDRDVGTDPAEAAEPAHELSERRRALKAVVIGAILGVALHLLAARRSDRLPP